MKYLLMSMILMAGATSQAESYVSCSITQYDASLAGSAFGPRYRYAIYGLTANNFNRKIVGGMKRQEAYELYANLCASGICPYGGQ